MAAGKIEICVLSCDQGMGTLLKIYDSAGTLGALVLIDLGSEARTKGNAQEAIGVVNAALIEMRNAGRTPGISLLIVSHQDFDHWSLLPDLLLPLGNKLPITLGGIVYGGTDWRAAAKLVLLKIAKEYGCACTPIAGQHESNYLPAGKTVNLFHVEDVILRTLVVNTPSRRNNLGLRRNGSSAVIAIHFAGQCIILPGDATSETLAAILWVLQEWATKGFVNPLSPCLLLTAPHHGALFTLAGNFTSTNPDLDIARSFAGMVAASNVAASAGMVLKFRHPFKEVMDILAVSAGSNSVLHSYVVFDQSIPKPDWIEILPSTKNIFTTITTLATPIVRISWTFILQASGTFSFREIRTPAAQPSDLPQPICALPSAERAAVRAASAARK